MLSSIALEEIGLAHIINAEGEKIQYILGTLHESTRGPDPIISPTICDILQINKSVRSTLDTVMKKELLLDSKLKNIINIINDHQPCVSNPEKLQKNIPINQPCDPTISQTYFSAKPGLSYSGTFTVTNHTPESGCGIIIDYIDISGSHDSYIGPIPGTFTVNQITSIIISCSCSPNLCTDLYCKGLLEINFDIS